MRAAPGVSDRANSAAGGQAVVDLGTAHGALAMTTPGDNAMVSLPEVKAVARGQRAEARR